MCVQGSGDRGKLPTQHQAVLQTPAGWPTIQLNSINSDTKYLERGSDPTG